MPGCFFRNRAGIAGDAPSSSMFTGFFKLLGHNFPNLIRLNLIFCAFSLLIVTIGPAIIGMLGVLCGMLEGKKVSVARDFWDCFLRSACMSFFCSLIYGGVVLILGYAVRFYISGTKSGHAWMYPAFLICALLMVIAVFSGFYLFLMIAISKMPLRRMLGQAFLLGATRPAANLTALFCALGLAALAWKFPFAGLLGYIFIGFSLTGLLIAYVCHGQVKSLFSNAYTEIRAQEREKSGNNNEQGPF